VKVAPPSISRSFYAGSFLFILSLSVVSLYPAPHLVSVLGAEKATKLLATVSSAGALTEIGVSPAIGALVDALGRKPILVATMLTVACTHAVVSLLASSLSPGSSPHSKLADAATKAAAAVVGSDLVVLPLRQPSSWHRSWLGFFSSHREQ